MHRYPTASELEAAKQFIRDALEFHEHNEPVKVVYPTHVEHEMFEEMTGESFIFREHLDVYDDYQPDLKDSDVGPAVRALADYFVVLFNTNEFVYVY